MSENNQQLESFDDELLSAYVDGELTGEQLAQVEQRLADDPQSQQLVDELRALSTGLQSLPRLAIGEDLRAEVLQRSEQAMLLGGDDARKTLRNETGPNNTSTTRRWIWAVAALAATVLLSLYLPATDQPDDLKVAQAKPTADPPPGTITPENPEGKLADGEASEAKEGEEAPAMAALETDTIVDESLVAGATESSGSLADASHAREAGDGVATESATPSRENRPRAPGEMLAAESLEADDASAVAAESSDDDVSFACQVHLVFNDNPDNFARFDETMFANSIVVENESDVEFASGGGFVGGGRAFGGEPEGRARENDGEGNKEVRNGIRVQSSDSAVTATRGQRREFKTENRAVQEELVMVELPVEQFEQLLNDFNKDTGNYVSVRVEETDVAKTKVEGLKGRSSQHATRDHLQHYNIDRLQQYNRGIEQLKTNELQELKSRASRMFSQSRSATAKKSKLKQIKQQRGRALRLNNQQYSYAANGEVNIDQTWLNKNFKNQNIAKTKTATITSDPDHTPASQDPIQVLIILQQTLPHDNLPQKNPPGEPASAGGQSDP